MYSANPMGLTIALITLLATIGFALTAPQTGSRSLYVATLICAAGFLFPPFIIEMIREGALNFPALIILFWVFLTFAYFVGIRVVMKKRLLDLVDHSQFRQFVTESGCIEPFAKGLLYLGPLLFAVAVIGLVVGLLKATGISL